MSETPEVKRKLNPEIDSEFSDIEVQELRIKGKLEHKMYIDFVIPKAWKWPVWTLSMAVIAAVLWVFVA